MVRGMARGTAEPVGDPHTALSYGDDVLEGSSAPLVGPGNGVEGDGWFNWATVATSSSTNSTMSVMAVARRMRSG